MTTATVAPFDSSTSVIIPTRSRARLLLRAISSALQQTSKPLEVLVVVDGPDEPTERALRHLTNSTVQVLYMPQKGGAFCARNAGIHHARGEWIALLDDDDEWLPNKLERQLRAASQSGWKYPIVCSQLILRTPRKDVVVPLRGPEPAESADRYLFRRKTFKRGEALVQSSNLLAPRTLFRTVPFRPETPWWDDIDWVLRACRVGGAGLEFVPEPLSVYYAEDTTREARSGNSDCELLFAWAKKNSDLFAPEAYSGALLISIAHEAVRKRSDRVLLPLLKEALHRGRPDAIQLVIFFSLLLARAVLPFRMQTFIRSLLQGSARSFPSRRMVTSLAQNSAERRPV